LDKEIDHRRRRLLATSGALAAAGLSGAAQVVAQTTPPAAAPAASAAKPLPPYVAWKDADSLIIHTPTTIETKRTAFGSSLVTPADRLYIRNNLAAPDVSIVANRDAWTVEVQGVKQPRSLTVAELKTLGLDALPMVLQCSGNGRAYFPAKISGTPWKVGAAGCLIWSGVPLRNVVEALGGLAPGARFITGTGGEAIPAGVDPKSVIVERSIPISMLNECMLAWEMNGEPVPHAHGGPLRLIVPGYSGVNSVKYIKRLAFSANETDAAIQTRRYRLNPPGTKADPNAHAPVWEMDAKSWINSPAPEAGPVRSGWVQIHGVAMGGMSAARRVEVSLDGGKTWRDAAFFGPNLGPYAWRQFVTQAQLRPGKHVLASRATDSRGNVQVEETPMNADGYLNAGWRAHMVEITVV
jgi:DMSO/TMAO reductase YedYZ molybdopterin-dependent catalytic subunit